MGADKFNLIVWPFLTALWIFNYLNGVEEISVVTEWCAWILLVCGLLLGSLNLIECFVKLIKNYD